MKIICYKSLAILAVLIYFFCSCNDTIEVNDPKHVKEGEKAEVVLSFKENGMNKGLTSGLTPTEETTLRNISILIFNKNGRKISFKYFRNTVPTTVTIPTQSGNNMNIYVIANLNTNNTQQTPSTELLDNISTKAELDTLCVRNIVLDADANRSLVMQGSATNVTIQPGTDPSVNTFSIPLNYVASKVTVNFISQLTNTLDKGSLLDWHLESYPIKSYILPNANNQDAVKPGQAADYVNSNGTFSWTDTTFTINGTTYNGGSCTFYVYENRRGTNSSTTAKDKGVSPPTNATVFKARGFYERTADHRVLGIGATFYLGANVINDFNVVRQKHYVYNIHIKGVNDYAIDSRIDSVAGSVAMDILNYSTLDAHYDYRPVRVTSWNANTKIEILNTDGTALANPSTSWLKMSRINLMKFVSNGTTYVRPTYNPSQDMVTSDTLQFNNTATSESRMLYLYADEYVDPNASPRSLLVRLSSSASTPQFTPIDYTITQYPIMGFSSTGFRTYTTAGAVTTNDYTFGVERYEETNWNLTPGAPTGTEKTATMQWGYNLTTTQPTSVSKFYYNRMGYENTVALVLDGSGNLVQPFGRLSAASGTVASTRITEDVHDPIFNTYAARYCFEKNRDTNGDGKISGNEIKWYLPGTDEDYMLWMLQPAMTASPMSTANYSVSSEFFGSPSNQINSLSYFSGLSGPIGKFSAVPVRCIRKLTQTVSPTTPSSPYIESGTRIMNNTGFPSAMKRTTPVSRPTPINAFNSAINATISPRFQIAKADVLLNGSTGAATMTWSQAAGWTTASDNSSTGVVASPATGCNAYSETGAAVGTWRLPTMKELYLIMFMDSHELLTGQDGYTALTTGQYWSSSQLSAAAGINVGLYNLIMTNVAKTNTYRVRCIRDL